MDWVSTSAWRAGTVCRMSALNEQVVLITGAARGIGAGTAQALVGRGARVVLTDLDASALEAVAAELGEERALAVVADVCDLAAMQEAVRRGAERFGKIDAVIANAGISSYGSVRAVDPATFRRVLDVNVVGVFHTVRAALPHLLESRGYVLVVSSLAAFTAAPGLAAYNASKAGAEHFANALRLEVAHLGVDVGSAHMSWIDTPLVQEAKSDLPSFRAFVDALPAPLNRTADVEECVDAFVKAVEQRSRRVYVPGWVGLIAKARALIASPLGDRASRGQTRKVMAAMDDEVARLGRSTSARNVAQVAHGEEATRSASEHSAARP